MAEHKQYQYQYLWLMFLSLFHKKLQLGGKRVSLQTRTLRVRIRPGSKNILLYLSKYKCFEDR